MFDQAFAELFSTVANIFLGVGNEQMSVEIRNCQAGEIEAFEVTNGKLGNKKKTTNKRNAK